MIGGRRKRRAHEGRVQQERIKPRVSRPPTQEEARHHARVRAMPCLVPGCLFPASLHHVTAAIHGGRIARSHKRVVPLCNGAPHHQIIYEKDSKNPISVEGLGHKGFYEKYRIDLLRVSDQLWEDRNLSTKEMP